MSFVKPRKKQSWWKKAQHSTQDLPPAVRDGQAPSFALLLWHTYYYAYGQLLVYMHLPRGSVRPPARGQ